MKTAEYVSRKLMDKYHDKFNRRLAKLNVRIVKLETSLSQMSSFHCPHCHTDAAEALRGA